MTFAGVLVVLGILSGSPASADTMTRGREDARIPAGDGAREAALVARFGPAAWDARLIASSRHRVIASAIQRPGAFAADTPVARPRPHAAASDPWLAEDKLKHFLMSFWISSVGYAAARAVSVPRSAALAAGATAGAAAGVWKEAHDRATGGDVSARDLAWDALGVTAGTALAAQTR